MKLYSILIVSDIPFNPTVGGIERVTDLLTKELLNRGHSVYYLCGKIDLNNHSYSFPVPLYQFPNIGLFSNNENLFFYRTLISDLRIEIVINQRGLRSYPNILIPRVKGVKIINVIHSTPCADLICFVNNILNLPDTIIGRIKKIIKYLFFPLISLYWRNKLLKNLRISYKELAENSDAIVTLSKKDVNIVKSLIGNSFSTLIVSISNPNAITINKIENKDKIVLYVGRLTRGEKNPIRLLKIWKRIYKKHLDWKLVIVGDGPELKRMKSYIFKYNLSNVEFRGVCYNVEEYYKKSSFVCLVSNYEGWGMVLTEGMSYGCIPISFNNYGAVYDIIDNDINGIIIPAYNVKKYANSLSKLMSDKQKCRAMSMLAIEKVKCFDIDCVVDKWIDLFEQIN